MKKLIFLIISLSACGGGNLAQDTTTTTVQDTTTTTVQDTTTTSSSTTSTTTTTVPVDYADSIDKNGFFLYFEEYRTTGYAGNIFLQLRGYWNEAKSLTVYFDDNCTIFEEIQYSKTNNSIGTIALNITETFEEKEECKESSKAVSIKVKQIYDGKAAENPYLNFLEDGKYFIGKINATNDDSSIFCCHDIEFNVLNYYISEILNTTTTTTLPPTTTTLLNQVCVEFVQRARDVDENIQNILNMEGALVDDVLAGVYTYGQAAAIQVDHVQLILDNYENWVYEYIPDSRNREYYFEYGDYLSDLFDSSMNLADYFIYEYSFYLDYWVAYGKLALGHKSNLPPFASCNY